MFSVQRKQNWIAIAGLCAIAFSTLFAVKGHINNGQGPVSTQLYIVQGLSIENMVDIVGRIDGEVTNRLPIIEAIGVNISPVQYNIIASNAELTVTDNHKVVSHGGDDADYDYLPTYASRTHITEQTGADILHSKGITGSGIGVAIIDSGLSAKYEKGSALRLNTQGENRVIAKYNAIQKRPSWELDDDAHGHGSHLAGIIASSVSDKTGKHNGIAPDANLISVKAFNSEGEGTYLDVIEGLNWLLENQKSLGIRVANLSFGAELPVHNTKDPLNKAVEKVWDAGIVVITSAGNNLQGTESITAPGNNPFVITVGAASHHHTEQATEERLTQEQAALYQGAKPEILSWDKQVVSADNSHLTLSNRDVAHLHLKDDVFVEFGTSQAAAVVSGTAALMLQLEPNLTPDDVKCRLMASATNSGNVQRENLDFYSAPAGLSNALRAVLSRASGCANNGLNGVSTASTTNSNIDFDSLPKSAKRSSSYLNNGYGSSWYKGENWNQRTALKRWKSTYQDDNQRSGSNWQGLPVNQGHLAMLINKDVNR